MRDCNKQRQLIAIDKDSLILLLPLERLFKFAILDRPLMKHGFGKCLSATPTKCLGKMHWLDAHKNNVNQLTYSYFHTIIIGDSIAAGLSCYSNVWQTFFKELLNLGIGGDCTQNILWRVEHLPISSHLKYVIIHWGTNSVSKDSPSEIENSMHYLTIQEKKPLPQNNYNRDFSEG